MQTFTDLVAITENASSDIPFLNEFLLKTEWDIIGERDIIVMKAEQLVFEDQAYSIHDAVSSGIIPFLIDCLKMEDDFLQSACLSILNEIAFDESKYNQTMIDYGVVPILIKLLPITDDENIDSSVRSHCIELLSALLKQQPLIFDQCMELGLHDILISIINPNTSIEEWMSLVKLIAVSQPNEELLQLVQQFLFSLEYVYHDETERINISIILNNLCYEENELCEAVIDSGLLFKYVPQLFVSTKQFTINMLMLFASIAYHQKFNQFFVVCDMLYQIEQFFKCPDISYDLEIMEEIFFLFVNLAKNPENIQTIIESDMLFTIIDLSQWSPTKETFPLILQNLMKQGTPKQVLEIIKMNAIPVLANHLNKNGSERVIEKILEAFLIVLQKIEDVESVLDEMEEYGVVEKIKMLQDHEKQDIYKAANELVETYFFAKSTNDTSESKKNEFELV